MQFDQIDAQRRYKLLSSTVTPRPIAWVSSLDIGGRLNAAPFSFFNVFAEDPPTVGFSILHRSPEDPKDTEKNIRQRNEFVINLVSDDNLNQMNISAIDFGPHIDEFAEAGMTAIPSTRLTTPRIGESRVSFECRLVQIIPLGFMRSLVLGEVIMMHISDDAVLDIDRGWIDTRRLNLVGRVEQGRYIRGTDVIDLPAISADKWVVRG
jgi:flavin reductase (DIM6/NTAB) family NADH-FMN oxidoreductase RutF